MKIFINKNNDSVYSVFLWIMFLACGRKLVHPVEAHTNQTLLTENQRQFQILLFFCLAIFYLIVARVETHKEKMLWSAPNVPIWNEARDTPSSKIYRCWIEWLTCCFVHWMLPYWFALTAFANSSLKPQNVTFLVELQLKLANLTLSWIMSSRTSIHCIKQTWATVLVDANKVFASLNPNIYFLDWYCPGSSQLANSEV